MHIKELTIAEFDSFARNNPLGSYYQSSNYAIFMTENYFEYDLLGLIDELGIIKAAALILIKKINYKYKFGYSPKGFLIDYFDQELLNTFCSEIKKYYADKLVFIKINPEIAIAEIDKNTKLANYNQNIIIRDYLKEAGFLKLKDNLYFESIFPRFNGIINLNEYNFAQLAKNTKNKIRKATLKGLILEQKNREGLNILYDFIKNKKNVNEFYYKNYYNIFSKKDLCDIFLVKIDYKKYLLTSKKLYDNELLKNQELQEKLIINSNETNINKKMSSDKALLSYKNDINIATNGLSENKTTYLAGAFLIRYQNRINIVISGFDKKYQDFNANYFLHHELIKHYQKKYKYLDLNGLTGDFNKTNPYKGLNEFKIGFNPHIYEFIGEYDLIINNKAYQSLIKRGTLAEFFQK